MATTKPAEAEVQETAPEPKPWEPVTLTNDGGKSTRVARTPAEETKLRYDGYRSAPTKAKAKASGSNTPATQS